MRSYFEDLENNNLGSYAVKSCLSKGKTFEEWPSVTRTCFQRDRDRIIHSKSFRRLKDKTQVFISSISDHYRSRLTHTIEVAQISRHLSRLLKVNEDLAECIALAHDLGHPPFGHSGETALNSLLKNYGGFEHNLHSLRVVEEVEKKYPKFNGLNLSFEVKEGLKKHETPWDNPNQANAYVTIEAQIANVADEIAYNNHDIDDGISSGILHLEELIDELVVFKEADDIIRKTYKALQRHERTHLINSYIISQQVMNVFENTRKQIKKYDLKTLDQLQKIKSKIVCFDSEMDEKNTQLRTYLYQNFYKSNSIQQLNEYGQSTIESIYMFLLKQPSLIPESFLMLFQEKKYNVQQVLGFYIAGMTDNYASRFCKLHGLNN